LINYWKCVIPWLIMLIVKYNNKSRKNYRWMLKLLNMTYMIRYYISIYNKMFYIKILFSLYVCPYWIIMNIINIYFKEKLYKNIQMIISIGCINIWNTYGQSTHCRPICFKSFMVKTRKTMVSCQYFFLG
jgi:hypothetical protein